MTFGLDANTLDLISKVFMAYPDIEKVLVYGSRAKGSYRKGSDIDLALFGVNLTHEQLSQIKSALDDLNTPYLFDVVLFSSITSADLIEHIGRVGQIFYEKRLCHR